LYILLLYIVLKGVTGVQLSCQKKRERERVEMVLHLAEKLVERNQGCDSAIIWMERQKMDIQAKKEMQIRKSSSYA
jgi:hypothetical protein